MWGRSDNHQSSDMHISPLNQQLYKNCDISFQHASLPYYLSPYSQHYTPSGPHSVKGAVCGCLNELHCVVLCCVVHVVLSLVN